MGFSLRRPDEDALRAQLAAAQGAPYTHREVGATREPDRLIRERLDRRYDLDHNRTRLGAGDDCWARARAALESWAPLRQSWVTFVLEKQEPPREGLVTGVLARGGPLWSFNACRIVYRSEESGPVERLAFAWGTLPDHVECGEERFAVERLADGSVHFDLLAFSTPAHPLARIGYPYARHLQRRFARGALAAMREAVGAEPEEPDSAPLPA